MSHGRHRPRRSIGKGLTVAAAVVVVAGAVGYGAVQYAVPAISSGGCGSNALVLPVSAAPDIAPAVTEVATRWNATKPTSSGKCVRAQVTPVLPSSVATAMTAQFVSAPKQASPAASPAAGAGLSPAVWIPDSMSWLDRVRAYNTNAFSELGASVASSPIVVAAAQKDASSLGLNSPTISPKSLITLLHAMRDGDLSDSPTKFQLGVANPATDTVGFATAAVLAALDSGKQDGLPAGGALIADYRFIGPIGHDAADSAALMDTFGTKVQGWQPMTAAVVSEQAVVAHNLADGGSPYKAIQLAGITSALDYPVATVAGTPSNLMDAAASFEQDLSSAASQQTFAEHGFRTPSGNAAEQFPAAHGAGGVPAAKPTQIRYDKKTSPVIDLWAAANEEAQVLTLVDVASSMGTASPYNGLSRLALTSAAAKAGLKLFTPNSSVGVWGFAPGITKANYAELVPLGPLNQNNAKVVKTFEGAKPTASTGCALYPALAAAYKKLRDSYVDGQINTVVVFTDCAAEPPDGSMPKSALLNTLENMADPASPIRVVLINVGSASNDQNLKDIASTVGGSAVPLSAPQQITAVFMGALVALS